MNLSIPLQGMKSQYLILVADRNPRIRDFVQRELKTDGYRVYTVENFDQLKNWLSRPGILHILVIDPSMIGLENRNQLEGLLVNRPAMPVIFHCMASDCLDLEPAERCVFFVEKSGQSVDIIRQRIESLFHPATAGPSPAH